MNSSDLFPTNITDIYNKSMYSIFCEACQFNKVTESHQFSAHGTIQKRSYTCSILLSRGDQTWEVTGEHASSKQQAKHFAAAMALNKLGLGRNWYETTRRTKLTIPLEAFERLSLSISDEERKKDLKKDDGAKEDVKETKRDEPMHVVEAEAGITLAMASILGGHGIVLPKTDQKRNQFELPIGKKKFAWDRLPDSALMARTLTGETMDNLTKSPNTLIEDDALRLLDKIIQEQKPIEYDCDWYKVSENKDFRPGNLERMGLTFKRVITNPPHYTVLGAGESVEDAKKSSAFVLLTAFIKMRNDEDMISNVGDFEFIPDENAPPVSDDDSDDDYLEYDFSYPDFSLLDP